MISIQGQIIQALELQKGNINLESGSVVDFRSAVVHCVEDGNFTITWSDNTTDMVDLKAGNDVAISNASVTVGSGKFHIDTF
jgi:spore coat polysaccharide biosynthesis predicted glycosyltransferase SpsG